MECCSRFFVIVMMRTFSLSPLAMIILILGMEQFFFRFPPERINWLCAIKCFPLKKLYCLHLLPLLPSLSSL